ncbi:hypothetical protein O0235_11445 [Tepidiforma flava]|uniref:Uncharacterized protein n=1 Tax=Tepidiforma flava TaxID=3004094 RepID=A0ABY7ME90_9CHLR|nr:hypothetical protein [Tepidiforma flava]WBL37586.1 hypothetical protein O0235_11445 [Tepidiforma flava]
MPETSPATIPTAADDASRGVRAVGCERRRERAGEMEMRGERDVGNRLRKG